MKTSIWLLVMALVGSIALSGCDRAARKPADDPSRAADGAAGDYPITGRVVSIAPDKTAVTLDHEDIPGLMRGMQMQFSVEDPQILEGIEPGSDVWPAPKS